MNIKLNCDIVVPDIKAISYQSWLGLRSAGVSGSDCASCCGLSPWKSAHELWQEKALGLVQQQPENDAMIFGRLLEPIVISEFTRRSGMTVHQMPAMLRHPKHNFMLGNVDGIVESKDRGYGVFEAKTTAYADSSWDLSAPDHYILQLQHYMAVTSLKWACICVLISGSRIRWNIIDRDDDLIADLIKLETAFWRYVVDKIPPPVDGSAACSELLARKYPKSTNTTPLILPSEADEWITEWHNAKSDEETAAERKRLAENKLKEAIGEHEKAISPTGITVTWKTQQSSRIDTARLKANELSVWERYLTSTSFRKLTISDTK